MFLSHLHFLSESKKIACSEVCSQLGMFSDYCKSPKNSETRETAVNILKLEQLPVLFFLLQSNRSKRCSWNGKQCMILIR